MDKSTGVVERRDDGDDPDLLVRLENEILQHVAFDESQIGAMNAERGRGRSRVITCRDDDELAGSTKHRRDPFDEERLPVMSYLLKPLHDQVARTFRAE